MCDIELKYLSNKCEHWMGIMEATDDAPIVECPYQC